MDHNPHHDEIETILAHIIQEFIQSMHQTGLSRPQIHALLHIYHAGECPVADIAALTGSSPAAASQLVERLVQQGLVVRAEDPTDHRIKKLRLTEKSLVLINRGITSNRFLVEIMSKLTPEQRQVVHTAFGYLAQAIHQHPSNLYKSKDIQHA